MAIKVSRTPSQIICIMWTVVLFATVPFFVVEMFIYYDFVKGEDFVPYQFFEQDIQLHCLSTRQPNLQLSLAQWMLVDQFSKLAIFIFVTLMLVMGCILHTKKDSVYVVMLLCALVMFIFFLFQLVWVIIGIYIFRSVTTFIDQSSESQHKCDERSIPFMWAFIIFAVILTVLCLVLSWLRPKEKNPFDQDTQDKQRSRLERKKSRVSRFQLPSERRLRSRRY